MDYLQIYFMPVNAPAEYFKAEEKFRSAKIREEKILALEEMIRLLPRHHGSENLFAQLKSRLAKLKKEAEKKGARKIGISKEGEAQVCLLGLTNSGKSSLLARLTNAKPVISEHPYTTLKPEVGMLDYSGIKIQLIEIPSTFDSEYLSMAKGSELLVLITRKENEKKQMKKNKTCENCSLSIESFVKAESIWCTKHRKYYMKNAKICKDYEE